MKCLLKVSHWAKLQGNRREEKGESCVAKTVSWEHNCAAGSLCSANIHRCHLLTVVLGSKPVLTAPRVLSYQTTSPAGQCHGPNPLAEAHPPCIPLRTILSATCVLGSSFTVLTQNQGASHTGNLHIQPQS